MPIIGRKAPAELIVDHPSVSLFHAEITHVGGDVFLLKDLQSSGGTFVNGQRVESARIQVSDEIVLGSVPVDLSQYAASIMIATPEPESPLAAPAPQPRPEDAPLARRTQRKVLLGVCAGVLIGVGCVYLGLSLYSSDSSKPNVPNHVKEESIRVAQTTRSPLNDTTDPAPPVEGTSGPVDRTNLSAFAEEYLAQNEIQLLSKEDAIEMLPHVIINGESVPYDQGTDGWQQFAQMVERTVGKSDGQRIGAVYQNQETDFAVICDDFDNDQLDDVVCSGKSPTGFYVIAFFGSGASPFTIKKPKAVWLMIRSISETEKHIILTRIPDYPLEETSYAALKDGRIVDVDFEIDDDDAI